MPERAKDFAVPYGAQDICRILYQSVSTNVYGDKVVIMVLEPRASSHLD